MDEDAAADIAQVVLDDIVVYGATFSIDTAAGPVADIVITDQVMHHIAAVRINAAAPPLEPSGRVVLDGVVTHRAELGIKAAPHAVPGS